MWVIARKSFFGYAGSISMVIAENQVFDLPEGTDWIEAGLVVPLEMPTATPEVAADEQNSPPVTPQVETVVAPESAAVAPAESAVLPSASAKKAG